MSDRLNANEQITVDQNLTSQNSQYTLTLQADGLTIWVISQPHAGNPIWGPTPLVPAGSQASRAVMQPNGDFVVYDTSNTRLWGTDTAGHPNAYVVIEDNVTRGGRPGALLVVYDPNDLPLWASDSQTSEGTSWNTLLGTQQATTTLQGAGVMGVSHDKYGVFGHSKNNDAIHGQTDSDTRAGVWGECSGNGDGVHGQINGTGAAIAGYATASGRAGYFQGNVDVNGALSASTLNISSFNFTQPSKGEVSSSDFALTVINHVNGAIKAEGNVAGHFDGNVEVAGNIRILPVTPPGDIILGDCAEEFELSSTENIEPGSVMVLNQSGHLEQSNQAYDKKVAGIVSGAGNFKPALILDNKTGKTETKRIPIALMGKVYCKVDATPSSIEIGDLLTTSTKKGHAMKAEDPFKAFGAVIGKALGSINKGLGMIPVLVALQ